MPANVKEKFAERDCLLNHNCIDRRICLPTNGRDYGVAPFLIARFVHIDSLPGVTPSQRELHDAIFSPDNAEILTAGDDGTAKLWQISPPSLKYIFSQYDGVVAVAFSKDEQGLPQVRVLRGNR